MRSSLLVEIYGPAVLHSVVHDGQAHSETKMFLEQYIFKQTLESIDGDNAAL